MITEWFLGLAVWLGQLVLGMMPEDQSGELVESASGIIAGVVDDASGVSIWFPWGVLGIAAGVVFAGWAALFVLKIVRQLLAHIPLFGGSG